MHVQFARSFCIPLLSFVLVVAACGGRPGGGGDSTPGGDGGWTGDGSSRLDSSDSATHGDTSTDNIGNDIAFADGHTLTDTTPDGIPLRGNMLLCGGHACQCSDGIDNDMDGLTDALDPECVSPYDDDEHSFATGIPGDNMGSMAAVECFFDGDSGRGNDSRCVVPNGCDCRGCCDVDVNRDGVRERVYIRAEGCRTTMSTTTVGAEGGPCEPSRDGGTGRCNSGLYCVRSSNGTSFCSSCPPCMFAMTADCTVNECKSGERCVGDPPPPPPPDGGVDASTSPPDGGTPRCPAGVTPCLQHSDCSSLGSSYFCITGCCQNLG